MKSVKLLYFLLPILGFNYVKSNFDDLKIYKYLQNCKNFSGAVLISQNGKIFRKAYGFASYEFNIPNTAKTKFRIASNTKPFTALAIMQLVQMSLINVDDSLNKYIPDFVNGDKIKIHHLLTHTAGVRNFYNKKWDEVCCCKNLNEMVNAIKTWQLDFEPGTDYSYSNSGYTILAYLIEKLSGKKYADFLLDNIFKPLNMNDTGSCFEELVIKNKAFGYCSKNNKIYNSPSVNEPVLVGNGDLYSTIDDMHKFMEALFDNNEKIINKKNKDIIFTKHFAMKSSADRYHGYGWFIDKRFNKKMVEYSGGLVGYLSKVMRFVDDNLTITILTNVEDKDHFFKICDDLPAIVFDIK